MARRVIQPGGNRTPTTKPGSAPRRLLADGKQVFEVILYNKRVRDALDRGEAHPQYDDDWAENRYIEVEAETPEIARRKISSRYPKHLGFVIVDVVSTDSTFDEDM